MAICCKQAVCTECFFQTSSPQTSAPCPFCNHAKFLVRARPSNPPLVLPKSPGNGKGSGKNSPRSIQRSTSAPQQLASSAQAISPKSRADSVAAAGSEGGSASSPAQESTPPRTSNGSAPLSSTSDRRQLEVSMREQRASSLSDDAFLMGSRGSSSFGSNRQSSSRNQGYGGSPRGGRRTVAASYSQQLGIAPGTRERHAAIAAQRARRGPRSGSARDVSGSAGDNSLGGLAALLGGGSGRELQAMEEMMLMEAIRASLLEDEAKPSSSSSSPSPATAETSDGTSDATTSNAAEVNGTSAANEVDSNHLSRSPAGDECAPGDESDGYSVEEVEVLPRAPPRRERAAGRIAAAASAARSPPQSAASLLAPGPAVGDNDDEDEDEEMRLAIAMSLREQKAAEQASSSTAPSSEAESAPTGESTNDEEADLPMPPPPPEAVFNFDESHCEDGAATASSDDEEDDEEGAEEEGEEEEGDSSSEEEPAPEPAEPPETVQERALRWLIAGDQGLDPTVAQAYAESYAQQLQELEEMGFVCHPARAVQLLERYQGRMIRVVNALTDELAAVEPAGGPGVSPVISGNNNSSNSSASGNSSNGGGSISGGSGGEGIIATSVESAAVVDEMVSETSRGAAERNLEEEEPLQPVKVPSPMKFGSLPARSQFAYEEVEEEDASLPASNNGASNSEEADYMAPSAEAVLSGLTSEDTALEESSHENLSASCLTDSVEETGAVEENGDIGEQPEEVREVHSVSTNSDLLEPSGDATSVAHGPFDASTVSDKQDMLPAPPVALHAPVSVDNVRAEDSADKGPGAAAAM